MSEDICIRISHLSKTYNGSDTKALDDVSLSINQGEIFGLLGPNGAGKTTFLSILCGLIKSSSGEAMILNYSLSLGLQQIKKMLGIVPQQTALYSNLSGRDNLLFIGRMYGIKTNALKIRVDELLNRFGFGKNGDELVKKYSGGMQRRINLLGGLLHNPKILLLDEPTVGMDVQSRTIMMEYLKTVNEELKMTILYTSHYMEQAAQFCDRIAIMDKGNILCLGTPEALLEQESCEDLESVFLKLTGRNIRD